MQENINPRRLWRYYLIAISLVAIMATTEFVTGELQGASLKNNSAAIDMSGRQRMLSQQIAFFANSFINADEPAKKELAKRNLQASLALFEKSHAQLSDPSAPDALARRLSSTIKEVYFREEQGVDAVTKKYIALGAALLTAAPDEARAHYEEIAALGPHVILPLLDEAVQAFEIDADNEVTAIRRVGELAYFAMLAILILEVLFIFWPAHASVVRALDEAKKARGEALAAQKQAEQASQLKSEFLANMSHEIRTPLNGVISMAHLMKRTPLTDHQQEISTTIIASGKALLAIINDVLDVAKIEAGLMALHYEPFRLANVLEQAKNAVFGVAASKGVALSIEIDAGLYERYCGDQKRIQQILINLAGNAVKFSDEGAVRLYAAAADGAVLFSVSDDGPGVAPEQQEAIFERFAQVDTSSMRRHGGTGLGLAISKEFVEMMGGAIGVESALGEGATFWFCLPLEPAPAEEAAPKDGISVTAAAPVASAAGNQKKSYSILLADDNHANQMVVTRILEPFSHIETTIVDNGQKALDAVAEADFDLVLMDINMPVMSGDEAIRRIRASGASYSDVPIVALTANATKGQRDQYLNDGATAYVSKPIDVEKFELLVGRLLLESNTNAAVKAAS